MTIEKERSRDSIEATMMIVDKDDMKSEGSDYEGYSTPTASSALELNKIDELPYDGPVQDSLTDDEAQEEQLADQQQTLESQPTEEEWLEVLYQLKTDNEDLTERMEMNTMDFTRRIQELEAANAKLRTENEDLNKVVAEIEVEAEQQYTEMVREIDELCDLVLKKDEAIKELKQEVEELSKQGGQLQETSDAQKDISERQKDIIEELTEKQEKNEKQITDLLREKEQLLEELRTSRMRSEDHENFLAKEAQMSVEIEDLQRELERQRRIISQTSMAQLAESYDRRILQLENIIRERDILIHKQNQTISATRRRSPSGARNDSGPSTSSESVRTNVDFRTKDSVYNYLLSDRMSQLANVYNISRVLDLTQPEEETLERYLSRDRF